METSNFLSLYRLILLVLVSPTTNTLGAAATVIPPSGHPAANKITGREKTVILDSAYACHNAAHLNPVVLLHGLGSFNRTGLANFEDWLQVKGFCTFSLTYGTDWFWDWVLDGTYGGLQAVEQTSQVIAAFMRDVHAKTGSKQIDVVGHSEGAFQALYTAKFGEGISKIVDKIVTISPPTVGTTMDGLYNIFSALGVLGEIAVEEVLDLLDCAGANDLVPDGAAVTRLNAELPIVQHGNRLTILATKTDAIVTPPSNSFIREPSVTNLWLQDHCPSDQAGHIDEAHDVNLWNLVLNSLEDQVGRNFTCQI